MASFSDNTITSVRELADAIDGFLTGSAGFTQDVAPNGTVSGDAAWNAGECFVQMGWDTETHFDLYHSEGFTAPLSLGNEDNDSNYPKIVDFFGTTLTSAEVFGFANNSGTATDRYAHFVVEFNRDGRFIHFGFGHIPTALKVGSWDGGAYVYGGKWDTVSANTIDPDDQTHRLLLDSNHSQTSTAQNLATMTCRNHQNGTAGARYVAFTNAAGNPSNDQDANAIDKADGQVRHGMWPAALIMFPGNPNNAMIPLIPILVFHQAQAQLDTVKSLIGSMPDVAVCNISNIQAKEQITVGSDTYMFFPWAQKLTSQVAGTMESRNAGIAYKVV